MPTQTAKRINSIDVLRGIVMVVMALDHVRDFFSGYKYEPTDLQHASTIMFFTRWITHFCAPTFVFLSGASAFLSMSRGKTLREQSWLLFTRGLWLIVLEVTIIRLGWAFDIDYSLVILQVIWAIGVSMIALSALIYLPRPAILTIGLAMIFGHDLLNDVHPAAGAASVLWQFLHVQGPLHYGNGNTLFIIYPLIPWIGVMATGYCFGALLRKEEQERNKWLYGIGLSSIALFIVLRAINTYGDPSPWHAQATGWRTVLSFLNCSKYPPSLLYLLMTLGPAITLLPVLERGGRSAESVVGKVADVFKVYGRVPMFYYILHIYLLHGMAILGSYMFKDGATVGIFQHPGYSLVVVYAVWLLAVTILYFPSKWFMQIKQARTDWWLSYI